MYSKVVFTRAFATLPLMCCGVLLFFGLGPLMPRMDANSADIYAQETVDPENPISAIAGAPDVSGFALPGCGGDLVEPVDLETELRVAELVNQERANAGLPPMKLVAGLSNAARYHAADMTHDDYFEHDSYDRINGTLVKSCDWFQRIQAYYPSPRAENIAWGYRTPESVMTGWMNSSGHRANILGDHREIGVGLFEWRWVQDFGSRRDVYPLIINNEAIRTETPQVQLYVYGQWDEIRLRNDGGQWSDWMPFQNEMGWRISAVPGKHLVEAEMRDASATVSSSDSIDYVGAGEPTAQPTPTTEPTVTAPPTAPATATETATDAATSTPSATPMTPTATPLTEPSSTAAPSTATNTASPVPPTATNTPTPQPTPTAVITEPHLAGRVALEGRPAPPHPQWVTQVQVNLADVISGDVQYTFNTTTTENGDFSTQAVEPGSYLVTVKGEHTLQRVTKAVIDATNARVNMGLLAEGDIYADNMINVRDFSIFRRSYGSCETSRNADLDGSGCIDMQDLQLLIHNFGLAGETLNGEPPYAQTASAADLEPMPEPPPAKRKRAGQRFTVALVADGAPGSPIDAGAFYLNFDPDRMQIVDVVKGGAFDVMLTQNINNKTGEIDFAVGALDAPATAPAVLALLVVESVDDLTTLPFILSQEGMRTSDVTFDGQSLITDNRSSEQFALTWQEVTLDQQLFLPLVEAGN
ncbi:MAG: CAP domain-containing protein [Caldilineaceae bacterium]